MDGQLSAWPVSLPAARRGEKDYLRGAWSAPDFDFEATCRSHGRNDAFWVLCYRRHLDGEPLPDQRERNRLVRAANQATGGRDQLGELERYTRYEAQQTREQVARDGGRGTRRLIARRRACRRVSPAARRVLAALCDVAEATRQDVFACSHRRLAEAAGVDRSRVAGLLRELEDHKQVFRRGFAKAKGHPIGTSCFTLYPPRPAQNIDELEPPRYDVCKDRWTWSSPLAKGSLSQRRWRWLASRAQRASAAANVPTVSTITTARQDDCVASAFKSFYVTSMRGSP